MANYFELYMQSQVKLKAANKKKEELESGERYAVIIEENTQLKATVEKLKNQINSTPDINQVVTFYKKEEEVLKIKNEIEHMEDKDKIVAQAKLIDELLKKIETLQVINKEQAERIAIYEAREQKDSGNSNLPPSQENPFTKKTKSTRVKSGKPIGGQEKHEGKTLELDPNPDEIIYCDPPNLCSCGGHIIVDKEKFTPHQEIDIVIRKRTTEERQRTGICDCCGKKYEGNFSKGFQSRVQYGQMINAIAVYLRSYCKCSINKINNFFEVIGKREYAPKDGTIVNMCHRLAKRAKHFKELVTYHAIKSLVLGGDETPFRVNGKLKWVQVFVTKKLSLFSISKKRGDLGDNEEILKHFVGTLVHDHFSSYYSKTKDKKISHAECNDHIKRTLIFINEVLKHNWAKSFINFLLDALKAKRKSVAEGLDGVGDEVYNTFSKRYDEILAEARKEYEEIAKNIKNKKYLDDARRLIARLTSYKKEHLLFLTRRDIPFTNNDSEQGVRSIKDINPPRSDEGAEDCMTLATVTGTTRKCGENILKAFIDIFNEQIPLFLLSMPLDSC